MIQDREGLKYKFSQLIYNWACNKFGEEKDIILNEIQDYGKIQVELIKAKLDKNPNLSYQDVRQEFDDFITTYTIAGMYWWRFCSMYNDWNDVIDTNKVRAHLWNKSNWQNFINEWNGWVGNKYAKILTRGGSETFSFVRENIDNLYSVNGLGFIMSNHSSKLLDMEMNFDLLDLEAIFRKIRQESEVTFSDWCGWTFDIMKFTRGFCF